MPKYKCVVIAEEGDNRQGERAPGKTSLIRRLRGRGFDTRYNPTVGVDLCFVSLKYRKGDLRIWDTAGQKRFLTLRASYVLHANIVFYCVDFSTPPNTEKIQEELRGIKEKASNTTIILVATKCDLYMDHAQASVEQLAHDVGVDLFIITSAKTGLGFDEKQGPILTDLILANLPALEIEEDVEPIIPEIPAAFEPMANTLLDNLRDCNLTTKQHIQIVEAIIELDREILTDVNNTPRATQDFTIKCHTILQGKHPYIMNAVYAFVGAVVVAGVIATAGILGIGVAAVVPVALVSCIWGGATGALISNGLFSRTFKQERDADIILNHFATQVNEEQNPAFYSLD